ncbi:metal ABC transporter substrate-binding protein [Saccharothrix xinjiangensis]|uniref:Metal ABC transporter substrate-binding protein n=1 Tax=Saccharothrix xinjiangensis TaxID=204798 RepID=A0ABV9XY78_9PSEU
MSRRHRRRLTALLVAALAMTGAACTDEGEPERQSQRLDVVVNIFPLRWLAEQIGGDLVDVRMIEADPHEEELSQADRDLIGRADANLFALNLSKDLHDALDAWRTGNPERKQGDPAVYDISSLSALDLRKGPPDLEDDLINGELDPHFWTDPRDRIRIAAEWVKNQLVSAVAFDDALKQDAEEHRKHLVNRMTEVVNRLAALDEELKVILRKCAGKDRVIVPEHPAFGYFAETYGLRQLPVTRMLKGELGPLELQEQKEELATLFKGDLKPAFFYAIDAEQLESSREQLTNLATEHFATPGSLDSLEREPAVLKSDGTTMDYIEGMRWNARNVAEELGCA